MNEHLKEDQEGLLIIRRPNGPNRWGNASFRGIRTRWEFKAIRYIESKKSSKENWDSKRHSWRRAHNTKEAVESRCDWNSRIRTYSKWCLAKFLSSSTRINFTWIWKRLISYLKFIRAKCIQTKEEKESSRLMDRRRAWLICWSLKTFWQVMAQGRSSCLNKIRGLD